MNKEVSFISDLIQHKEELRIEFKGEYNVESILKIVCSFLNTEGGWILVGYDGKKFHPILEDIEQKVRQLKNLIAERIFPQPLVDVRNEEYNKQHFIILNVIKGSRQPYSYDRKYFVRSEGTSKEATADEISLLLRTSNDNFSTWEKQTTTEATIEDLTQEEVIKTIREAKKIGRGGGLPETSLEFLSYFQLIDMNLVRNGCVVLYGKTPIKFILQCQIRITVMPYGKTGSRYDDTVLIEDNLFVAFNRLQEYFTRNLPIVSHFSHENWNRINKEKYPPDALDEAILNAMVHRDYGDISGEITVNIYPEKIEIINSGEIPPNIIEGKNIIKEHHSVFRNPIIAHMFYLRGKIEKLGRGLSLIRNRCTEFGLRLPEWSSQNGFTTLTIFGSSLQIDINERMFSFLKQLKTTESFGREDYEKFHEGTISEKTARNDITKLLEGNWISKIGKGPSSRYIRTIKELPDVTR